MKYFLKPFFYFALADFVLNYLVLFIWRNSYHSIQQAITFTCIPFLLTIVMVRLTEGLSRMGAVFMATALVIVNCLSLTGINLLNPFGRLITAEEYEIGIRRDITVHLFFFVPVSIVLALIFRKRKSAFSELHRGDVIDSDVLEGD